jgi:hypothetical protein
MFGTVLTMKILLQLSLAGLLTPSDILGIDLIVSECLETGNGQIPNAPPFKMHRFLSLKILYLLLLKKKIPKI